jgi:hypothetical protein
MPTNNAIPDRLQPAEQRALQRELLRMNEQGWGLALGALFGIGLFLATLVLVLRGGEHVGAHLNLLSVYFPGYSVTFLGCFVGFVYAFFVGYAVGRTIGTIYNRVLDATS